MHILIIPSWYPKNHNDIIGSFFREQALSLQKFGYKVGVIYPQLLPLRQLTNFFTSHFGENVIIDKGLPTYRSHGFAWFPRVPYANAWLWTQHGLKLFKSYIAEHGKPDIIHAHSLLNGGKLALAIQESYGINYLVTEHSRAFECGLIKPWQKKLAVKAASMAHARLAVSESFVKLLDSFFDGRVTWSYLPNILSARFEKAGNHNQQDKKFFTFCNVSLIEPHKGIDILLITFAKAFARNKKVRLKIGGDGTQRTALEALTAKLHISEQVDFLGMLSRDQVIDLMKSSHAYVLSSHIETFGVAVIESLSLGKPVVATRCGGPESIVRPEDGYLVPKGDLDAMSNAMHQLYKNYDNFDPIQIRQSCLGRFGEKTVIKQLTDIYHEIVSGKVIDPAKTK